MTKRLDLFKAFADEPRVLILRLRSNAEPYVGEWQATLRLPQPAVSRHLAYL